MSRRGVYISQGDSPEDTLLSRRYKIIYICFSIGDSRRSCQQKMFCSNPLFSSHFWHGESKNLNLRFWSYEYYCLVSIMFQICMQETRAGCNGPWVRWLKQEIHYIKWIQLTLEWQILRVSTIIYIASPLQFFKSLIINTANQCQVLFFCQSQDNYYTMIFKPACTSFCICILINGLLSRFMSLKQALSPL